MSKLLSPEEFLKVVEIYKCGPFLQDYLRNVILDKKVLSGRYRTHLVVRDCRGKMVLGKFPDLYMTVYYQFNVKPAAIIIDPNDPESNVTKVSIGFEKAEELTKQEFEHRMDDFYSDEFMKEAAKTINPDKNGQSK